MQSKVVQIENTTANELLKEVSKLLDNKFKALAPPPPADAETYITRQQVCEMFSITLPTVHAWIKAKILNPYKIGNKTRFILSEVKASAKGAKAMINHD
jgi:excisionase family DNA binding protein